MLPKSTPITIPVCPAPTANSPPSDITQRLSQPISAIELADVMYEHIQHVSANGYKDHAFPEHGCEISVEMVKQEWLYFDTFTVDFCVFALFKERERKAILDRFWSRIGAWLGTIQVPSLPERIAFGCSQWKLLTPEAIGFLIPAEKQETAHDRIKRRAAMYGQVIRTPHPLGENWGIAKIFACACGSMDGLFIFEIAEYFHWRKMTFAEFVKSYRVTISS